jgi:hypothetical protein
MAGPKTQDEKKSDEPQTSAAETQGSREDQERRNIAIVKQVVLKLIAEDKEFKAALQRELLKDFVVWHDLRPEALTAVAINRFVHNQTGW